MVAQDGVQLHWYLLPGVVEVGPDAEVDLAFPVAMAKRSAHTDT